MNSLTSSQQPAPAGAVAGVARLMRQVCVLREQGDPAQAARLQENEFAAAVRDFRLAQGPEALPESELRAMFAVEERRVAEAAILSELLLPRLVGKLPALSGSVRPAPARSGLGSAPAARAPPPAGPPAIPDLLDAMLAAERHGRGPPAATNRES